MPRLPVLKPREVVRALERLGFVEVRQVERTANFGTRMEEVQRFLSIQAETLRRRSCDRSSRTLASLKRSFLTMFGDWLRALVAKLAVGSGEGIHWEALDVEHRTPNANQVEKSRDNVQNLSFDPSVPVRVMIETRAGHRRAEGSVPNDLRKSQEVGRRLMYQQVIGSIPIAGS